LLQRRVCELSVPPETKDPCSEVFATSSFVRHSGPGPLLRAAGHRLCFRVVRIAGGPA
jgi:hypothetical protein